MSTESTYFEQIPDYLDGSLSKEKKKAFERQMAQDENLSQEVDLHREVTASLADRDRLQFRGKLREFNRANPIEIQAKKNNSVISLKILVGIAASVLILVALGTWFYQPGPSAREQLTAYLENYDPVSILPSQYLGSNRNVEVPPSIAWEQNEAERALHHARQSFSRLQYPDALSLMKTVTPDSLTDKDAFFYELGVLYLLEDQPRPAIAALEKIDDPALQNPKYWHLALAYLQIDRIEESRNLLQQLDRVSTADPWQKKARQLLPAL